MTKKETPEPEHTIPAELAWSGIGTAASWAGGSYLAHWASVAPIGVGAGGGLASVVAAWYTNRRLADHPHATESVRQGGATLAFTAAATDTGWLTYATATGDTYSWTVMGGLALAGSAVWGLASLLRSSIERREHKARNGLLDGEVEEKLSDWARILRSARLEGLTVVRAWEAPGRRSVVLTGEPGGAFETLSKVADPTVRALAHAADLVLPGDVTTDMVEIAPGKTASLVEVHIQDTDVLASDLQFTQADTLASINDPVTVGQHTNEEPVQLRLTSGHLEIIGTTQYGKSTFINTLISYITRCADAVAMIGGTHKFSHALEPWIDHVPESGGCPINAVAPGQDNVLAMLASLYQLTQWRNSRSYKERPEQPTREWPAVFAFIDEAWAPMSSQQKIRCHDGQLYTATDLVQILTRTSAGAHIYLVLATQAANNSEYASGADRDAQAGAKIKGNILNRVVFNVGRQQNLDQFFYEPGVKLLNRALSQPGSFYAQFGQADAVRRGKGERLHREAIPGVARRRLSTCGQLPTAHAEAMTVAEGWYGKRWSQWKGNAAGWVAWVRRVGGEELSQQQNEDGQEQKQQPSQALAPAGSSPASSGDGQQKRQAALDTAQGIASEFFARQQARKESRFAEGESLEELGYDVDAELARMLDSNEQPAAAAEEDDPGRGVPEPLASIVRGLARDEREVFTTAELAELAGFADTNALGSELTKLGLPTRDVRLPEGVRKRRRREDILTRAEQIRADS